MRNVELQNPSRIIVLADGDLSYLQTCSLHAGLPGNPRALNQLHSADVYQEALRQFWDVILQKQRQTRLQQTFPKINVLWVGDLEANLSESLA